MTDELNSLLHEAWEYNITKIHTSFPGKVVKYDQDTRRAEIQPSLKRRLPDGKFVDFPILPDVPIQFPGTSEYTIHFPLNPGDEVDVKICERSTDVWRDSGDKGIEDSDPRRFNLQDCYATPGLQPIHFIPTTEKGLAIIHHTKWDGDFISSIAMDDDKIEVLYKDKTKDSFSALVTKDKVETIHKKDDKEVYYSIIEKDKVESIYKKDDVQIAKTTIDDTKIETLYKAISSGIMTDDRIEVKYKQKADLLMNDNHLNVKTANSEIDVLDGNYLQTTKNSDIESDAPIGLNLGLYKTGLGPYLTSETKALTELSAAAAKAAPQLAILDALSGGTGFIVDLGKAIVTYCTAMMSADTEAHATISKAVK
jgi:hypothetical protein